MKSNLWIYLSCLLVCVAIGYRVLEYEKEDALKEHCIKVNSHYEHHIRDRYSINRYMLIDNTKRRRNLLVYQDSLSLVEYLVDNNKMDDLREMWMRTNNADQKSEDWSSLFHDSQMYSYANGILEHYKSATVEEGFFESIEMNVDVVYVGDPNLQRAKLRLDFYSVLDDNVSPTYVSDGQILPVKFGGAISTTPLNSLIATLVDDMTGYTKTYRFNDIKIH